MGHHLSVGLRAEVVALRLEAHLELGVVLEDTVVDDHQPPAAVRVRVRVDVRGAPMGCPAGVAEACGPAQRVPLDELPQAIDLANAAADLEARPGLHGEPGGVITAVLETPQPVQQDGNRVAAADVPDDATHGLFSPVRTPRAGSRPASRQRSEGGAPTGPRGGARAEAWRSH